MLSVLGGADRRQHPLPEHHGTDEMRGVYRRRGNPLVNQNASDCPESIGCHDLRRVAITRMQDEGVSWDTISGRVNATVQMLKEHYDSPTHAQAAERRREEVLNAL